MSKESKKRCQFCGGLMAVEFFGNYGDVYPLMANGKPGKKRIRRKVYPMSQSDCMIYCRKCGRVPEEAGSAID